MGIYVNPGNSGFQEILNGEYIDKTGLIALMNQVIDRPGKLLCISRPRRFGKSYAAKMLTAYYDSSCDSHALFDDKIISKTEDYCKHLNHYHVICLDITGFISQMKSQNKPLSTVPAAINNAIRKDLSQMGFDRDEEENLNDFLIRCVEQDGRKFIFIIDEWDAMIREGKEDLRAQEAYLNLLRSWFKNTNFTPKAVAAAFMTGILPIKKDGSQSAISDFKEYSMIKPRKYGEYVGFTEEEVACLCEQAEVDYLSMKQWYDGYVFKGTGSVYNPNSVMQAIENGDFDSYWTETSAAEGLLDYISKDYNGLTKTIAELVGGVEVKISTTGFANDLTTFRGKDDVLTLMIHLGYLAYDSDKETVRIPNEEIKREFQKAIREVDHSETIRRLEESEQLFLDTIHKNEKAVAAQIEKIHREETVPIHYNREESLRSVIKLAYYTYRDHYLKFEELPSGEGYADVVYLARKESDWPTLIIELKWNETAEGGIEQIRKKKYQDVIKRYGNKILLVGISYQKDPGDHSKKHICKIEEYRG